MIPIGRCLGLLAFGFFIGIQSTEALSQSNVKTREAKLKERWSIRLDGVPTELAYSPFGNSLAISLQGSGQRSELWELSPGIPKSLKLVATKRGKSLGLHFWGDHWVWAVGGLWKVPMGGGDSVALGQKIPESIGDAVPFAIGPDEKVHWAQSKETGLYFYLDRVFSIGIDGRFLRGSKLGNFANECRSQCKQLLRDSHGRWLSFSGKNLFWNGVHALPSAPSRGVMVFGRESGSEELVILFPGEKKMRAFALSP